MCTKPNIINGYEVSCRECDQCAATYKNTWVSRCVAEKQTMPHAYALTLTYADIDGEPPLGARVYRYKDVQNMWMRIRSAARRKWKGEEFEMRYVVVGEKGTRFGRCHYHGVVFSSHPIIELGKLSGPMGDKFQYKRRLDWSIWGHGFVEFQMADRKGIAYCLKYILKSRMTAARSTGFGREGKTEWLASSYMWCSTTPAVGANWLWEKLSDLVSKGVCPPALRVRVPGGGDWYVSGALQKDMCLYLHDANEEYRKERGRDLAGWSTLIKSVQDEIELADTGEVVKRKPWEWLTNGDTEEEETEYPQGYLQRKHKVEREQFERELQIRQEVTDARQAVRKCGDILPCVKCTQSLTDDQRADLRQEYLLRYEEWQYLIGEGSREEFEEWWRTRLRPSRGCGLRDEPIHKEKFARLVQVTKAQPGLRGKAAIGKAL